MVCKWRFIQAGRKHVEAEYIVPGINDGNAEDTRSKWKPLVRHKPPGVSKQDSKKKELLADLLAALGRKQLRYAALILQIWS